MTKKSIDSIIIKFLNNEATSSELEQLVNWIEANEKNHKTFKEYLAINHTLNKDLIFDAIKAYNKATIKVNPIVRLYKRPIFKYAVAAAIAILLSLPFVLNKSDAEILEPIIVNNNIKVGTDKATLTLEDGSIVALEKGQEYVVNNLTSNGEAIIYDNNTSRELVYNHLTIPRGGQFQLTLSDGTRVWLNSETQLKYPVSFTDGESRQVELVYGEAYFDVSPSTKHEGASFKVIHEAQEVQVLGTEFNIKAYKDETNIYTTLVEGEVVVDYNNESKILTPNEQSNLDLNLNSLKVSIVDVYDETAWKKGIFSFKNKPLKDIAKVLSRWYDMDVIFMDKSLEKVKFKGVLGKDQPIEEILAAIKSVSINNYQINDKTIIIK